MRMGSYLLAATLFCFLAPQANAAVDCNTLSGTAQRNCRDAENKAIEAAIKQKTQNLYKTIYAACKGSNEGPGAIDDALICSQIKLGKILQSFN